MKKLDINFFRTEAKDIVKVRKGVSTLSGLHFLHLVDIENREYVEVYLDRAQSEQRKLEILKQPLF